MTIFFSSGRSGHMSASVLNSTVVTCGGVDSATRQLSRKCWSYSKGASAWRQVPGLREAARYGAAAAVGKNLYVMGGTDGAGTKSDQVQVN